MNEFHPAWKILSEIFGIPDCSCYSPCWLNGVPAKKKATKKAAPPKKVATKRSLKKTATEKAASNRASSKVIVTDDIGQAAYLLFLTRQESGTPGTPEGDWLEAERLLNE